MDRKNSALLTALVLISLFPVAFADAAPPPMRLWISYNTSSNARVVSGWLYQCNDMNCSSTAENTVRITCKSDSSCESIYYPYTGYQKLAFRFSDNTIRESGVLNVSYPGNYDVLVNDDNLLVTKRNGIDGYTSILAIILYVFIALIATVASELLIAFAYIKLMKKPWWILLAVIAANIISLPLVWVVSLVLSDQWPAVIVAMELAAIAFEAYFIHWMNRKIVPLKDALILSAAMNIGSLIVGWIVLALLF
jgi:hypothetical protein